ncbi:MAG TPA: DUF5666 domain-containing protein, partial [Rhodothermales bacterium]|nr:DUF5666 domain-containing protein [Rhodothermales bacterium]
MNSFRLIPLLLLSLLALPLAAQPLQWEERAPMMTPRFGLTVAVLDGHIYVLGGQDALGNILDTTTRYNPRTNQWSTLPPMNKPRVNAAAVTYNGKVYVIGGRSSDNTVLNDVEFFDPATNTWQPFHPIAVERQGLAAVLRDTSLFVAGGSNAADEILDSIEIYDDGTKSWVAFDEEIRITDVIEAIGSSSITVAGIIFAVTSETEIKDIDGNDIMLNDLSVGMTVEIRGENDASGTLTATRIEVEDDGSEEVRVTDVIEALESSSLTVAGLFFEVNSATEIEDAEGQDIPFSSLGVGMTVEARGERALNGTITATRIRVEDDGAEDVEVTGFIEELGASSLTVAGTTFEVNAATEIEDENSNAIPFADLDIGMQVEVRGEQPLNGPLVATRIEIVDTNEEVRITDIIEAIGSSSITVAGIIFAVTSETEIKDIDGNDIMLNDLSVGMT